jgi:hypothetical protein
LSSPVIRLEVREGSAGPEVATVTGCVRRPLIPTMRSAGTPGDTLAGWVRGNSVRDVSDSNGGQSRFTTMRLAKTTFASDPSLEGRSSQREPARLYSDWRRQPRSDTPARSPTTFAGAGSAQEPCKGLFVAQQPTNTAHEGHSRGPARG